MHIALSRPMFAFAAIAATATALRAQGADDCATPQPVSGTGAFRFDTRAATTGGQGQGYGACLAQGTAGIERDVWFAWTAPQGGDFTISTCGLTSVDTKIALYSGLGCPASAPLACSDDACAYQSRVDFIPSAGGVYTIQIGSFPGAPGGLGSFSIESAAAPPDCLTGSGPDLIVGNIVNVYNAPSEGAIDALALGATACNVGTAPIDWNGSVGASPVIRQNLYRYKVVAGAGRFEQVGLSWLKHGFFAVQETFCCTCQPEPGNDRLGLGCSDTYVAGINAAQAYLTPNWEVNAHTGAFPFPSADPPWSGTVARRLQVALADLEPTGGVGAARYFAEGLYVARDDATAGNQNNNASWREFAVTGGTNDYDFDLAPGSHTECGDAALRVWRKIDPAVRYAELQIPGDGLLMLCWRVTPLGGGMWHYEYALQNLNADRNVGSFSLPVPQGVAIANVGFHAVHYHSGDGPGDVNFSAVDWLGTLAGGALTWATETEAQNASANALRWGTLCNFRFDAPRPPRSATATLGLWKSGTPARVTLAVEAPGDVLLESFCPGDGSLVSCPCGNDGATDHGCENSAQTGGARLSWTGSSSLSADDLVLTSSGERSRSFSILLQGDQEISPANFGDGLRCAGGNLIHLYVGDAAAGAVTFPQPGDPSISARSAARGAPIPPNGARSYQVYYRDPAASFCPDPPGGAFNVSNGLRAIWGL